MSEPVLRLLYVCDFGSIHSRSLVQHFARSDDFDVTVFSTTSAAPMAGVTLHAPDSRPASSAARHIFEWLYPAMLTAPRLFNRFWARKMLAAAAAGTARLAVLAESLKPDVVHALRVQPEGIVALEALRGMRAHVPLFLTIWGLDLELFAESDAELGAATAEVVRRADVLLPDNARDGRIARARYGLRDEATLRVMPASGGIDATELDMVAAPVPPLRGEPAILTARGFESGYIRLHTLLRAFAQFVGSHPNAHLYIAVPDNAWRRRRLSRRVRCLNLVDHVTVFSPDRATLLAHMRGCDVNAFAASIDGLSISLLESLYLGGQAVVAAHDCYTPPLEPGVNAETFASITPDAIADALRRVAARRDERPARAANGALLPVGYERTANLTLLAELYARYARQATVPVRE